MIYSRLRYIAGKLRSGSLIHMKLLAARLICAVASRVLVANANALNLVVANIVR